VRRRRRSGRRLRRDELVGLGVGRERDEHSWRENGGAVHDEDVSVEKLRGHKIGGPRRCDDGGGGCAAVPWPPGPRHLRVFDGGDVCVLSSFFGCQSARNEKKLFIQMTVSADGTPTHDVRPE
jgi:hypothetical protein